MNPARKLAQQRWSKTTKEERSEHARMMALKRFKSKEEMEAHMKIVRSTRWKKV